MPIRYAEHAPSPALADAVRCFWTMHGTPDAAAEPIPNRVLPDNCIDVIFDLRQVSAMSEFVVGPMLSALVFTYTEAIDMVGVRFRPGAATEFLDLKATELAPADIPAADVWADARALRDRIGNRVGAARLEVLDAYLVGRRRVSRDAALAQRAASVIMRAHGKLSVDALTNALAVTERTLQRAFESAVGIGPKQVLKVQRFRSAASMMVTSRPTSLSRIAAACGYADQPHFTRDFTALAGVSPKEFRTERRIVGFLQD